MSTDVTPPPPAPEQPAPPRKRGFPKWLISLIVLVVAGGGFLAYRLLSQDVVTAKSGDCAKVSGAISSPKYDATPCDSGSANYIVGKSLSNTSEQCGDPYPFEIMTTNTPKVKLCLIPKWNEGECHKLDTTSTESPALDCATAKDPEVVKVTKVVKDKADQAACGEAAIPLAFPQPPMTLCLAPAQPQS